MPSANEIAVLVRDSRPEKLTEITTADVKIRQRERLTPEEAETLTTLHQAAEPRSPVQQQVRERLVELDREDKQLSQDRRGVTLLVKELQERISSSIGERDPYWEQWYDSRGRPLEESTAVGRSPKLYEYIDGLNKLYEEWRSKEIAADIAKLEKFEATLRELDARETAILKERLTLKVSAAQQLAAHKQREQLPAVPSATHAVEHVFERVSVAKTYEVKTAALRHGRGRVDLGEIKSTFTAQVESGEMLLARGEVATKGSLERERRLVALINEGIGQHEPLGGRNFVVSDRLKPEQKAAVSGVLESHDFAINLRGAAGTGKTTTLEELHRGLQESKRNVMAVAPTASAVEELQRVGFRNAMTISRLLADPKQQHALTGHVLIMDEAGMVGSKDMEAVLQLAKAKNARLVFSGDTAQIKSVLEGDALRVLERESSLRSLSLMAVQRQTNQQYKTAIQKFRQYPKEGFALLNEMEAIREVDWRLRSQEVAQAFREQSAGVNSKGKPRQVMVIAATHDEIKNVTFAIRKDLKRNGKIAQEGELFVQHTALGWTEAQKKQAKNYQPGQVIEFHKAVKAVADKHETVEVVRADRTGITVRRANGSEDLIAKKNAPSFHVYEREQIEVTAGDKLLLQSNWRDKHFSATNGELVTVKHARKGVITLEDGRKLPAEYRQFSHGYAVTPHRSQGKTIDVPIIAAEEMNHNLFYVAISRGREKLVVITSDVQRLEESVAGSGQSPICDRVGQTGNQARHQAGRCACLSISAVPAAAGSPLQNRRPIMSSPTTTPTATRKHHQSVRTGSSQRTKSRTRKTWWSSSESTCLCFRTFAWSGPRATTTALS